MLVGDAPLYSSRQSRLDNVWLGLIIARVRFAVVASAAQRRAQIALDQFEARYQSAREAFRAPDGAALVSAAFLLVMLTSGAPQMPPRVASLAMQDKALPTTVAVQASATQPSPHRVPDLDPDIPHVIALPREAPIVDAPVINPVAPALALREGEKDPAFVTVAHPRCDVSDGTVLQSTRGQRLARAIAPPTYRELTPDLMRRALVSAAQNQRAQLAIYNAAYTSIAYPGGDVPSFFGVCTDVIIRAYRTVGIDLQALVQISGTGTGDRSIDHRRTDVLRRFFALHAETIPVVAGSGTFLPGDIVTYYRPQNRSSTAHMAMVSDRIGPSGQPMILHNRGWGVQEEDALFVDKMTGHYRLLALKPELADKMERVLAAAGLRTVSRAPEMTVAPPSTSPRPLARTVSAPVSPSLHLAP